MNGVYNVSVLIIIEGRHEIREHVEQYQVNAVAASEACMDAETMAAQDFPEALSYEALDCEDVTGDMWEGIQCNREAI